MAGRPGYPAGGPGPNHAGFGGGLCPGAAVFAGGGATLLFCPGGPGRPAGPGGGRGQRPAVLDRPGRSGSNGMRKAGGVADVSAGFHPRVRRGPDRRRRTHRGGGCRRAVPYGAVPAGPASLQLGAAAAPLLPCPQYRLLHQHRGRSGHSLPQRGTAVPQGTGLGRPGIWGSAGAAAGLYRPAGPHQPAAGPAAHRYGAHHRAEPQRCGRHGAQRDAAAEKRAGLWSHRCAGRRVPASVHDPAGPCGAAVWL